MECFFHVHLVVLLFVDYNPGSLSIMYVRMYVCVCEYVKFVVLTFVKL